MKEAPVPAPKQRRRPQIRANLQRLRASRRQGMFGVAEILGLGVSALILIVVIISYVYFLVPARSRRDALQLERSRLQTQLRNSQDIVRVGENTQTTVTKITESLEGFQNNRLSSAGQGRMSLYGELNQLIRKNSLRNTSGPSYTPLASSTVKQNSTGTRSASTKWQSVYPGIAVSLTVEGQYQNLRRFIRDLEVSRQFIIINAIELERATETNSVLSAESSSNARNSLVSLRLDMATYFQLGTDVVAGSASQ
jgi:Tfp pilus assembly protein PilO